MKAKLHYLLIALFAIFFLNFPSEIMAQGSCAGTGASCVSLPCCTGTCRTSTSGNKVCTETTGEQSTVGAELCHNGFGVNSAIGCIPFGSNQEIAAFFLKWGLGIGGGIAFILIVVASYQIMSSSGDPRKLQVGKELMTAAITGLLLLVFSAFLLQFVGVNLLGVF